MSRTTTRAAALTGLTATTVATGLLLAPAAFAAPSAPVVAPSAVAVGEEFTVTGEGCLPESDPENPTAVELFIEDGTESGYWDYVDPATDGSWSATLSFLEGTAPKDYVIETACLDYLSEDPRFVYPNATVTLKGAPASTPSTPTTPETTTPGNGWGTPTNVLPTGEIRGAQANTPGVASPDKGAATGDSAAPGRKVVKVLTGFKPGEVVTVTLHSTPQTMGRFTADQNGTVTVSFTVPAGTPTGDHTLVYEGSMGTYFQESFSVTTAAATSNASSSSLAYTGADVALPLGLGVGALAIGGGLVFAARRRAAEGSQA